MITRPHPRQMVCLDLLAARMTAHRVPERGAYSPCGAGPWTMGSRFRSLTAERLGAPLCIVCFDAATDWRRCA